MQKFLLIIICFIFFLSTSAYADQDLFAAARNGDTKKIASLVKNGVNVNAPKDTGWTPLWEAVLYDQPSAVTKLIELGADPNASQGKYGPILILAAGKDTEILKDVLKAGADVKAVDKQGRNALNVAASIQADILAKVLAQKHYKGKIPDALENAALLISAKTDVNHASKSGETPLLSAIRLNNKRMLKLLLKAGANVNQLKIEKSPRGEGGFSNLMLAIDWYSYFKDIETIKLLLEHGADPNYRNEYSYPDLFAYKYKEESWSGYSPLTFSAARGYYPIVKLLLQKNADPTITRKDGKSALEIAQSSRHMKTAQLLKKALEKREK